MRFINGYAMTRGIENREIIFDIFGNIAQHNKPMMHCSITHIQACLFETVPDGKGLKAVLST
jgi:hypothetical protein